MKGKTSLKHKFILVVLGLFLSVLLIEIGLRLSGFIYLSLQEARNKTSLSQKDVYRIMCLGDSTTAFGDEYSYPSQLEQILQQKLSGKQFSVINKGVPGINTIGILSQLKYNLYKYQPDMVIVMMGINESEDFSPEDSILNKIKSFIKTFRIYKFVVLLRERIDKNSNLKETYLRLGRDYLERNNNSLAEKMFKQAITLDPKKEINYVSLGLSYSNQGKFAKAEEMFKKAIALDADNWMNYIKLAWCYSAQGKFSLAEEAFKKVIEISHGAYRAYIELGTYYQEWNNFLQAEEMFKKALAVTPLDDGAYKELGECYKKLHNYPQAEEMFKKSIALAPDNHEAYIELGLCYNAQEKFNQAEESFKQAISINKKYAGMYARLELLHQTQSRDKDVEAYWLITEYGSKVYRSNYQRLRDIILNKGIKLVSMQYPMRSLKPLKELLGSQEDLLYVDNEKVFKEALKNAKYEDYFIDKLTEDFGHCTPKGNWLIANNIADVLLKEDFSSAEFQDER